MEARMALKDLIDHYATESDMNNQDYYREIFRPDIKMKIYFGEALDMDINNVENMIAQYKAFGRSKASFLQNGQQVVIMTSMRKWKDAGGLQKVNSILFIRPCRHWLNTYFLSAKKLIPNGKQNVSTWSFPVKTRRYSLYRTTHISTFTTNRKRLI